MAEYLIEGVHGGAHCRRRVAPAGLKLDQAEQGVLCHSGIVAYCQRRHVRPMWVDYPFGWRIFCRIEMRQYMHSYFFLVVLQFVRQLAPSPVCPNLLPISGRRETTRPSKQIVGTETWYLGR